MTIHKALLYASVFSAVIPLSAGLLSKKQLIWYYVLIAFMVDICLSILMYNNRIYKNISGNTFLYIEYILLSIYYGSRYIHKYTIITGLAFVVLLSAAIYTLLGLPETFLHFNSIIGGSFYCMYIIYTIAGFYLLLNDRKNLPIERSSFFWVNVAFIMYASGTLLLLALNSYYNKHNKALIIKLWPLHNIFNILKNIFLTVALIVRKDKLWTKSSY